VAIIRFSLQIVSKERVMTVDLHGMFRGLLIANRCNKGLPLHQTALAARHCDVMNSSDKEKWKTVNTGDEEKYNP
jgi:hypothetical protein